MSDRDRFVNRVRRFLRRVSGVSLYLPVAVFVAGVLLTALVITLLYRASYQHQEANFARAAGDHIELLYRGLQLIFRPVAHVAAVFSFEQGDVSSGDFAQLAESVPLVQQQALRSIQWIPRLRQEDGSRGGAYGWQDIPISEGRGGHPAPERAERWPIVYAYDKPGNESVLGFDLLSDPIQAQILRQAAGRDHLSLSRWYQAEGGVFLRATRPIFEGNGSNSEYLMGFVSGVYRVNALIGESLPVGVWPVELYVEDGAGGVPGSFLCHNGTVEYGEDIYPLESARQHSETLQVFGTSWRVTAIPAPGAFPVNVGPLAVIGASGLLLSALLASYLRGSATREAGIRKQVAQRTQDLARSESRYRLLVETLPYGLLELDHEGRVQYVNSGFLRAFGFRAQEVTGKGVADFFARDDSQKLMAAIETQSRGADVADLVEARVVTKGNDVRDAEITLATCCDRHPSGVLMVVTDVTQRNRAEALVRWQAHHDPLTKLPNRTLFLERAEHAIASANRRNGRVALLFLDLDNFKWVNDTLGHAAGDALLRKVARILESSVRSSDTVAHIGGDEFTLLFEDVSQTPDIGRLAKTILERLSVPFVLEGSEVFVSASIGITEYPTDGTTTERLLKNADTAMYRAKAAGGNRFRFFTPEMNAAAMRRLTMERALHGALDRDELQVFYQPVIDARHQCVASLEALVRWRGPDGSMIRPEVFIRLAEELGLVVPIGERVLRQVCAQKKAWMSSGVDLPVSVNLSVRQCFEREAMERLIEIIDDARVEPQTLAMEVTESVVLGDKDECLAALKRLKESGVSLAIDDFGTGYSSLSYLKRLPVDTLKVDKGFLRNVTREPDKAALVEAILAMARALGKGVVAEGVESHEQAEFLRSRDCDFHQGFLYSPPLPVKELEARLQPGLHYWKRCNGRMRSV